MATPAKSVRAPGARDGNVAALLTWLVPGAGHLYLGRPLLALAAFVVIESLYYAGIVLSDGRLFEFLQPELRGPFAGALTPEAGNLGALIWHMRKHGFGQQFPSPWPPHIDAAAYLTSLSGLLNVCLMAQAHVNARYGAHAQTSGRRSPALRVLLAWLVPGLGHLAQRRKLRAALVFVAVVGMLALGTALAAGSNLDRERHFYYWSGQFLAGLPPALLELAHGHARVRGELPYVDAGLVFGSLAGLLNVLAMIDVYGWDEERIAAVAPVPARRELGAAA